MVEIHKNPNDEKELIIKATLLSYVATHALIITEQTLAQCYSGRFEAVCYNHQN